LISLPFGDRYVATPLADTVDDEFGPLPLPNLQGRWLFDHPAGTSVVAFEQPLEADGSVRFVSGDIELTCRSATPQQRAGCQVAGQAGVLADAFALLGNVTTARITFSQPSEVPEAVTSFQAYRLE
jgi:hypothetical protein